MVVLCTISVREAELGGFGGINYIPTKRADYIAKTSGPAIFHGVQLLLVKATKSC